MSYFEDYVEDGLCCQQCGEVIDGKEPGFPRYCDFCAELNKPKPKKERNIERSNYAIEKFKKNNIRFELKNKNIGHFHAWRKTDNKLFQFWAGTGKIMSANMKVNKRGIANLLKILEGEKI